MKPFRGTIMAFVAFMAVGLILWVLKPETFRADPVGEPRLFQFEKHELVRVDVQRPDGSSVTLLETDGRWIIEKTGHEAGRSMVNRVKHQIHDLTARASVVEDSESLELYGLGKNSVRVTLTLRDDRTIHFDVGDPNPTSVSYYIQPEGSSNVYTVKKAAVDYYSLTLDEFRERRFASFDSKDASSLVAVMAMPDAGHTLQLDKIGDRQWTMASPLEMAANYDQVRRLLGRISAIKASRFLPREEGDLEKYGLDHPRADITVGFGSRDPLRIRVGSDAETDNLHEELAYMIMDDGDTVYVARRGLLEEFSQDPATLRNRRVVKMAADDVVSIDAVLVAVEGDDLGGEGSVRYAAEQWVWKDGVPVSGSTPKRVARRLAELEVDEFVVDQPDGLERYGLIEPRARIVLKNSDDEERVIRIGGKGEPFMDPDGHPHDRYHVSVEGETPVYLTHMGVLEVVRDLVRESKRKAERDADKALRRERIESVAADDDP
jgi:hypothetical protein